MNRSPKAILKELGAPADVACLEHGRSFASAINNPNPIREYYAKYGGRSQGITEAEHHALIRYFAKLNEGR